MSEKSDCCGDKIADDGFGNDVCANCWKEQDKCIRCGAVFKR